MNYQWSYLVNTFTHLANKSMLRFHKFCYLFMQGLQNNSGDSFLAHMYTNTLPAYNAFLTAYGKNFGDKGNRKSLTSKQKNLLTELSSVKAHEWDVKIQNLYLENSPEYLAILPNGISPLSHYQIDMRILYVENMIAQMASIPQLSTLSDSITTFLEDLKLARNKKESKASDVKLAADELHKAAYLMAEQLYANLGSFMMQYAANPQSIAIYFPTYLLYYKKNNQGNNNNIYELALAMSEILEGGFNFGYDAKINMYNTGETILDVWFTDDTTSPKPINFIQLAAQEIKTITVSQYATQVQRFLMVENTSTTDEGSIEFSLV